jgi:hypothetical protein
VYINVDSIIPIRSVLPFTTSFDFECILPLRFSIGTLDINATITIVCMDGIYLFLIHMLIRSNSEVIHLSIASGYLFIGIDFILVQVPLPFPISHSSFHSDHSITYSLTHSLTHTTHTTHSIRIHHTNSHIQTLFIQIHLN